MSTLFKFLIFVSIVSSSYQLLENDFTYRYSEFITSKFAIECGWRCKCPSHNEGNLCNCESDFHNNGKEFTIESPYAAILIQKSCLGPHSGERKLKDVKVNMASLDSDIDVDVHTITADHRLLSRIKLMPKPDQYVKFDMDFIGAGWIELNRTVFEDLEASKNPFEKLVVIIPGWQSYFEQLHSAYWEHMVQEGETLMVVDWTHSNQLYLESDEERIYDQAVANTVYVGYKLGILLRNMKELNYFESIHCIGFDIGSHVAHFAAEYDGKPLDDSGYSEGREQLIDRITALDPPRYLFETDGLKKSDAKYVDVYHSNTLCCGGTTSIDIDRNLIQRNFGDNRPLGHEDIYINMVKPKDFSDRHYHPQCAQSKDEPQPIYGCHSIMAARFYLDSAIRRHQMGNVGYWSMNRRKRIAINYENTVCTVKDELPLSRKISKYMKQAEYEHMYPKIQLSKGREKLVPSTDVNITAHYIDVSNEKKKHCGRIIGRQMDSGRVWEGRNMTSDENYFPWIACIKQQQYSLFIYKTMMFDDELYALPEDLETEYIRRSETLTGLKRNIHYKLYDDFDESCTGSLIGDQWIVTAGHCFEGTINGQQLKIVLGKNDCGTKKEGINVDAFHFNHDSDHHKTVFINQKFTDDWDIVVNKWMESVEKHGTLATHSDVQKLLPPWEEDESPYESLDEFDLTEEDEDDDCKTVRYISEEFIDDDYGVDSDIALIKIPKQESRERINSVCYLSSISFDYNGFNQFFYMAGFGSKGSDNIEGEYLSWFTGLNAKEIDKRFDNLKFVPAQVHSVTKADSFLLSNVDLVDGKVVTSRTCGGDSGGPAFIYGSDGNDKPIALLVGTLKGRDAIKLIGDVLINRGQPIKDYDPCARGFSYNVYAKKIFTRGARYIKLSIYVNWIDSIINPTIVGGTM